MVDGAIDVGKGEKRDRYVFFFFQAEDGIRDYKVTGVQTCALPICPDVGGVPRRADRANGRAAAERPLRRRSVQAARNPQGGARGTPGDQSLRRREIGRASCRERV